MAYHGGPEQVIQPHGRDRSLLDQQEFHRSQHIWSIGEGKTLRCQRASQFKAYGEIYARILGLLDRAGFGAVARVGCFTIDQHLITGLVERWRPETHTFHFTVGEATITLQDVEVIMGLKVDSFPVTCGRLDTVNWKALCDELLGVEPDDKYIKGGRLSLTWLRGQFFGEERLREYATLDEIRQHTRAFILSMCGGLLFGDKTANSVHLMFLPLLADLEGEDGTRKYAWGAALLACMYRELYKASYADDDQIAGCLQLVQIWAYERIPILRPQLRNLNLQIPHDCPVSGR